MGMKLLYVLWFTVALATAWAIHRTHRFMRGSQRRIEEYAEDIARYLASERH